MAFLARGKTKEFMNIKFTRANLKGLRLITLELIHHQLVDLHLLLPKSLQKKASI